MDTLVRSTVSRNTWAIMKEFKVLPTDERFKRLTLAQREWIVKNMIEDVEVTKRAERGEESEGTFKDTSKEFDDFFNRTGDFRHSVDSSSDDDVLSGDEIYSQVVAKTNAEYNAMIDTRIQNAIKEKDGKLESVELEQKHHIQELAKKYKGFNPE